MDVFAGRTAVVTGGASGIGLGISKALARAGVNVALLDIQEDAAQSACREIERLGVRVEPISADVSDADSMSAAARHVGEVFGRIHILVNNAGVAFHGTPLTEITPDEWNWVIGVNILGVINGLRCFLPLIKGHGEEGHVVNTASNAGFHVRAGRNQGAYSMTKYAVIALSEALEIELDGSPVGVSVLCPAAVRTNFPESAKYRPERYGGPYVREANQSIRAVIDGGMSPIEVGERVLHAIRKREFYIFTHPEVRSMIEARHRRIMAAFDR